jgi:hypothetical protein
LNGNAANGSGAGGGSGNGAVGTANGSTAVWQTLPGFRLFEGTR